MTDIVEQLQNARSVDGSAIMMELPESVVKGAIAEIERLRSAMASMRRIAGAVSIEGITLADIKKKIQSGAGYEPQYPELFKKDPTFEPPDYDAFDANKAKHEPPFMTEMGEGKRLPRAVTDADLKGDK